jgi:adenosylcobinamide-GDP ribazoletransferase
LVFRSFLLALAFLTILPVRFRKLPTAEVAAASRFWFPVVALLLGAALGGWTALVCHLRNSPLVIGFLILLVWVVVTGALHLDGFCDLCDGLFGGHTPEERLRIMSDPHLGTFGLAGGVLLLLGKLIALSELVQQLRAAVPWLVAAAVVLARCLALCMAALGRYARPEGTGKALVTAARPREAILYAALGALLLVVLPETDWHKKAICLTPYLVMGCLAWVCQRRLGGVTGDCLGACIESSEVVFLWSAALAQAV